MWLQSHNLLLAFGMNAERRRGGGGGERRTWCQMKLIEQKNPPLQSHPGSVQTVVPSRRYSSSSSPSDPPPPLEGLVSWLSCSVSAAATVMVSIILDSNWMIYDWWLSIDWWLMILVSHFAAWLESDEWSELVMCQCVALWSVSLLSVNQVVIQHLSNFKSIHQSSTPHLTVSIFLF